MKYILYLMLIVLFSNAADNVFTTNQKQSLLIKEIILEEESISKAFETFIIENQRLPKYDELRTDDYLGSSFPTRLFDGSSNSSVVSIDTLTNRLTNRLSISALKNNPDFIKLYLSNLYRKRTYIINNENDATKEDEIGLLLEDSFAKHIYYLIVSSGGEIPLCTSAVSSPYCVEDSHLYVYSNPARTSVELLMYYHLDKFRSGPIIITNDTSLHITNDEFNSIPTGALLYDTDGIKYLKTHTSIELVK